ncbi:sodium:proton antiporter [Nitrospira sp. Kam-Ns4a]
MIDDWLGRTNFLVFVFLFLWGLSIMLTHHHLVKKLIGMYLVQTSVMLFFLTLSAKVGGTVAVLLPTAGPVRPEDYANPLPPALMLTAIVVGVATLGVSLALVIRIYRRYGTLDEAEVYQRMQE